MPSVDIAKLIESTKTQRARAQTTGNTAKITAMGGKPKKGGPSIFSRAMDILSRGQYAVAETANRVVKGESLGNIAKGTVGGLAGKNKTSFSNVIENAGITNKWVKGIGGLAGDIFLDPTTYAGAGLLKGAAKGAAKTAGAKAGRAAVDTVENVERILAKADAAKHARLARGPVEIKDVTSKTGRRLQTPEEVAKKAEVKAQNTVRSEQRNATRQAERIGNEETQKILGANRGRVELRFAGKKIASSEKLYKGGETVKDAIKGTEVGKWFGESFSTGSKFAEKTNALRRVAELRGVYNAEKEIRSMRDFFKPLSKDDKVLISHTLEKGKDAVTKMEEARPDLAPFLQEAQRVFRYMGAQEVNRGVFRSTGGKTADNFLLDNYVYHHYKGGTKASQEAFKTNRRKAVGPETPGFTQQRILPTLEEAKAAGLKPLEQVDDIIAQRMKKHHSALARPTYVESVAKEYGVDVGSKTARQMEKEGMGLRTVNSPYVPKGTVFPEHIAQSIETLEKMGTDDKLYGQFLKVFDGAQSYWKFGATSLNPGHHVRNMIGDGFNNFLDGVDNPYRYEQARKALFGGGEKFSIKTKHGTVDRAGLESLMVNNGAKSGFVGAELLEGAPANMAKGIMGKANQIAGKREEYMRTAHFIDALIKESKTSKTLAEAAEKAGARVRKWNLDYGDITDWERSVMKRAMPFYTWSRKNIPLQIEAMAMKPGRVAAVPKGQRAIQNLLGTDSSEGDLDTIPEWLREMSPIRLRGEGEGKNAIYWNPALPIQDIGKYNDMKDILSQLTPAAKIPIEVATGEQLFSGAPTGEAGQYAAGQVPLLRNLYNIATGKQKPTDIKSANYLTGLGLHEVTPKQRQGEIGSQNRALSKQLTSLRNKARNQ